jgi:hypothetical protein|tara:strand:- start:501 stop:1202 length:702 start_codon:yes stop_codon:yes gene_type:complete
MVVDLFLVYQFVRRLATPFEKWDAFEQGVIDKDGKVLIKRKKFTTAAQRKSWGVFDIMIANLKKILAKVPGGSSRLASYAAALYLIKEHNHFTDETLLSEDMTDEQLHESSSLFSDSYLNYIMLAEAVNPQDEAFGRARLRQNLAKMGHDVDKNHSRNVKDASAAKKRASVASKDLSSYRKKHGLKEEPANNVGSGNIAGMDGGHMSKAQQKAWTSKNKSKKKTLKDMMKDKT